MQLPAVLRILLAERIPLRRTSHGCGRKPDLLAGRWKQRSQWYSDRLLKSIQFRFKTTSSNRHADRRRFYCLSRCDRTCMERWVRIWLQMGSWMDAWYSVLFSGRCKRKTGKISQADILYDVFLQWALYPAAVPWWGCPRKGNHRPEDERWLWWEISTGKSFLYVYVCAPGCKAEFHGKWAGTAERMVRKGWVGLDFAEIPCSWSIS